jgi:hypothetical protein
MRLRSLVRVVCRGPSLVGPVVLSTGLVVTGCLDRPVGTGQPRTTNVLVDVLRRDAVTKIDLLFMIDNSRSMADKQLLFADALPDLVSGLVAPPCLDVNGTALPNSNPSAPCPAGSAREFEPVTDIHIGVITSSLGGYTSQGDCVMSDVPHSEQMVDGAHLLGSLPRGAVVAPSATDGFLAWRPAADNSSLVGEFRGLVQAAGERGCGWEASLESWYRFLIDPAPYRELVRLNCNAADDAARCIAPATDPVTGQVLLDEELLAQRRAFLRPDSLLAIVMLTDENDCSFRANGYTRFFAESRIGDAYQPAYRGTSACDDPEFGANSPCCHTCFIAPPDQCPTAVDAKGNTVGAGCEAGFRFEADDLEDDPNLRCFKQRERFGIDVLYPVERYSNALKLDNLCVLSDDLDPASEKCAGGQGLIPNPLFAVTDVAMVPTSRPKSSVFLAGIVGVPWQDLAVSPHADTTLVYRSSDPNADAPIDWSWILGERNGHVSSLPLDPLMIESVEPRTGTGPATGEALAPPDSTFDANTINGHEWRVQGGDAEGRLGDLQYACVFPLAEPVPCLTNAELDELGEEAAANIPNCDCTDYGADSFKNPLCQGPDGSYGLTQTRAKAYPGVRELQVLKAFGTNSVVASICPKTTDRAALDYGYRPAMAAIIERLKEGLVEKCLQRQLEVDPVTGGVECIIVEARPPTAGDAGGCEGSTRRAVSDAVDESVRRKLRAARQCTDDASCAALQLCTIDQLRTDVDAAGLASCQSDTIPVGDGWCYIDPELGIGNEDLVQKCPVTSRRKVRFVGEGTPRPGTYTVFSCTGATFDE